MTKDILEKATANFLSFPPIIHRTIKHKVIRTASENIIEKVITSIHSEIIWLLEEEGPLTISEIGYRLLIAKAQLTQLIDKLVVLGIVERRAVKGDRRKIEIILTHSGKKFLKEHRKNIDKWFMDAMSDISVKDLKSLSKALTKIKNILSKLK